MPRPFRRPVLAALALAMLPSSARAADGPAEGWIVWASNRKDGRHEIYLMQADGTGIQRLTQSGAKMPGWSPDGRWIAYTHVPEGSTHVVRWDASRDKKVCDGTFEFWMWDGSGLVCRKGDEHFLANPEDGSAKPLFSKSDFAKVASKELNPGGITRDGRYLLAHSDVFREGFDADNGSFKAHHSAVILDLQDKGKLYFFGDGCEPTAPPAGDLIYHVCGNCPTKPDPYRMSVKDLASRSSYAAEIANADSDWGHEYFPRVSNDNKWLAYGATTGCHDHDTCDYEIFVHPLGGGNAARTHVTTDPDNDQWPHLFVGKLPVFGCTAPSQCDDQDPCTADRCDAATEECAHERIAGCCAGGACPADGGPAHADAASGDGAAAATPDGGAIGDDGGADDDRGVQTFAGLNALHGGCAVSALPTASPPLLLVVALLLLRPRRRRRPPRVR